MGSGTSVWFRFKFISIFFMGSDSSVWFRFKFTYSSWIPARPFGSIEIYQYIDRYSCSPVWLHLKFISIFFMGTGSSVWLRFKNIFSIGSGSSSWLRFKLIMYSSWVAARSSAWFRFQFLLHRRKDRVSAAHTILDQRKSV